MSRTVKTEDFEVYTIDELSDDARDKAITDMAFELGNNWWDQSDIDDISDVIRYTLANEFGTPGHGDYGVADFPGIHGVTLAGWDLDRGSHLLLSGTLTRENAPRLPWQDGVVDVRLHPGRDYTSIEVDVDEDEVDLMNLPDLGQNRADRVRFIEGEIEQAIDGAMQAAMKSGREEMEYKGSAERAEEYIRNNDQEFLADGSRYFG